MSDITPVEHGLVDLNDSSLPVEKPYVPMTGELRREAVKNASREAEDTVVHNIDTAVTEGEYIRWCLALPYVKPEMIDWMWDYGNLSGSDVVGDFVDSRRDEGLELQVKALNDLKAKLDKYPDKDGFVKVGLKRIRDKKTKEIISYRVLARFPKGYYVMGSLYDQPEDRNSDDEHYIFYEPSNACVVHACDDLYRANKETDGVAYVPALGYIEVLNKINREASGVSEYMLSRGEAGKLTQDSGNYILCGLIGGFSNEPRRVRISDFWKKQTQSATTFTAS